jgi:hypothetical protein
MGKFKMKGHALPGPNQKPSVGKSRDIFKTFYDEEGNEQTKQISREEMADIRKEAEEKGEVLNTDIRLGGGSGISSSTMTTSGDDSFNNEYPNDSYTFTDQDAVDEIQANINSGDQISSSNTNEQLLERAKGDVNRLKNIKLTEQGYGSKDLQNISKQGGSRGLNQREAAKYQNNTFTASPEDVKNVSQFRNKNSRALNLLDFNKAENEKLNEAYRNRMGGKGGPSKKMKFGRTKK